MAVRFHLDWTIYEGNLINFVWNDCSLSIKKMAQKKIGTVNATNFFCCSFKVAVKLILRNKKIKTLHSTDISGLNAKKNTSHLMRSVFMIPVVGVEPTLQKEHDFESCASANSATPAYIERKKTSEDAEDRNRTGTVVTYRRILSPVRLPVPPPRRSIYG